MYNVFDQFIFRSPTLPYNILENILYDEKQFQKLISNSKISNAIRCASPVLFYELKKYLNNELMDKQEVSRFKNAILKYIVRMSTRCTPFGLFAGCGVGEIGEKTVISLEQNTDIYARFDMDYLCRLIRSLEKDVNVKHELKYYSNNSIYSVGENFRYIYYTHTALAKKYEIVSVEKNEYLIKVITQASTGAYFNDIIENLINRDISKRDATTFVEDLIEAQLLISELDPIILGQDLLEKTVKELGNIRYQEKIRIILFELYNRMNRVLGNDKISNLFESVVECANKVKDLLLLNYDEKFLLQIDSYLKSEKNILGRQIISEIISTSRLLNRITYKRSNGQIDRFKQKFQERYEEEEIPLLFALDSEIGIGYPVEGNERDDSSLLNDFVFPREGGKNQRLYLTEFHEFLLKKVLLAQQNKAEEIIIHDSDIKNHDVNIDDLPSTMYSLIQIVKDTKDDWLICMDSLSGASGANLLTRFAYSNKKIKDFCAKIVGRENELVCDDILAEISHLPSDRVGNILLRPHLREYEIACSSRTNLQEDKQIELSDLMLSIKNDELIIRSKKLNKRIIPRLTNAHSYWNDTIPVYRFLCDMQHPQGRTALQFNWNGLDEKFDYLPRVKYGNTILSLRTWKIQVKEFDHYQNLNDNNLLVREMREWRLNKQIPSKVLLVEGDNRLYVDLESAASIYSLFSSIKNERKIILTEFLFDKDNSIIKDVNGNSYLSEFIIVFYK